MRKKTIEEELEELRKEKENHIKKLGKEAKHSDDHVYDFDARYETHDFEEAAKNDFVYEDDFVDFDEEDDVDYETDIDNVTEDEIESLQQRPERKYKEARNSLEDTKQILQYSKNKSSELSKSGLGFFSLFLLVPCLALLGTFIGGILMIIFLGVIPITEQSNFMEITSIVQTAEIRYDSDNDPYASIKLAYVYNEEEYTCILKDYGIKHLNDLPENGDEYILKINPNNPKEAILPEDNQVGSIICMIFGSILSIFGLIGLVKLIKGIFN